MTWQSGGSGSIPGVTSDHRTPGGEVVAGALQAGNTTAVSVPSYNVFYGSTSVRDVPGNQIDEDATLYATQSVDLLGDNNTEVAAFTRGGALNGHDYLRPAVAINDLSGSAQPMFRASAGGTPQFLIDQDGVQVHGKLKTGASVTHTLGAYSGASVPIYDEAGTLLGYMPLYA